jgi:type IV secretion system protein VirD4
MFQKRRLDSRLRDVDLDRVHDDVEAAGRETWPYVLGGAVLGLFLTFWLAVQIASLLSFHWIPLVSGLLGAATGLAHLYKHLFSPGQGWPADLSGKVAPFWLLYPILAGFIYLEVHYGKRLWVWYLNWRRQDRGGTQWATDRDLEEITNEKKHPKLRSGVVLGISEKGKLLKLETQSHALVVAGTRSGKTAGLCTPALLTYDGVIIATSVKNDLVENTLKRRKEMGDVYIFDPVGAMRLPESEISGWTPLDTAKEWRGAQRTADALIEVAMNKKGSGGGGNMEFFKRMSQQTLPVLLYAAAIMDEDMRRVVRWLYRINDNQTHAEVDAILRWKNNVKALDAWVGFVTKEAKLRGDIAATMASALVSYEDEKVQQNAMKCDITPEKLFNGKANTLYVVAPMAEQARLEPIFVALMQSLLLWVTEQPKPLDKPLLCVLDEAANIAALPLLPELLSTIGGQNASIMTAWQDFSQIKARYGEQMNTILNNSRAKMVLPGVGDPETLQYFAQITGETLEENISVSGTKKHRQFSVGESRRSLLTPATIREQKLGEAIIVYGQLPPAKIKLRMWFKDAGLKRLANGGGPVTKSGSLLASRLPQLPRPKLLTALTSHAASKHEKTVIRRPERPLRPSPAEQILEATREEPQAPQAPKMAPPPAAASSAPPAMMAPPPSS